MSTTQSPRSLFHKVWDLHRVRELTSGQTQLFVGLHLVHEVTSPQAFAMLRERGLSVRFPERTFATVDHIIPTDSQIRPLSDELAEAMMTELERNCREHDIRLFDVASGSQGIVHVIGPELGLTQPGSTIACGDSHTSTHGAFGAIAFGIGTSQVRDVLATQCLTMAGLSVRRIEVTGKLSPGVYAKDVILSIIRRLGVKGGVGYAYEYAGPVLKAMSLSYTACARSDVTVSCFKPLSSVSSVPSLSFLSPEYDEYSFTSVRIVASVRARWQCPRSASTCLISYLIHP